MTTDHLRPAPGPDPASGPVSGPASGPAAFDADDGTGVGVGVAAALPHALPVPAEPRPGGREDWFFLSEALRTFRLTGAVAPSGADLVNALVVPATSRPDRPISVLEVGAGTGAVTRRLVRVLRAGDRLHAVESNPRFVQRLRADPELARRGQELGLRVSECRVQDLPEARAAEADTGHDGGGGLGAWPAAERYDVIVSGLPFTNFEPVEVQRILDLYLRLLVPGGELTYFSYLGTSAARLLTSGPRRGAKHRAVVRLLRRFEAEYGLGSRTAWRNVPPARAHLLRAPGGRRDSAAGRSGPAGDGPAGGTAAAAR
ncbi:class I SAM-dependent methyltransferase [Kitasatospora sp. NPDC004723]|uniref:class I SAM-dependent methyltransferase n=1 Tax=Kitasatospora sp. NPDC004723 TaxID=3154288 RepID=UPI0033AD6A03